MFELKLVRGHYFEDGVEVALPQVRAQEVVMKKPCALCGEPSSAMLMPFDPQAQKVYFFPVCQSCAHGEWISDDEAVKQKFDPLVKDSPPFSMRVELAPVVRLPHSLEDVRLLFEGYPITVHRISTDGGDLVSIIEISPEIAVFDCPENRTVAFFPQHHGLMMFEGSPLLTEAVVSELRYEDSKDRREDTEALCQAFLLEERDMRVMHAEELCYHRAMLKYKDPSRRTRFIDLLESMSSALGGTNEELRELQETCTCSRCVARRTAQEMMH